MDKDNVGVFTHRLVLVTMEFCSINQDSIKKHDRPGVKRESWTSGSVFSCYEASVHVTPTFKSDRDTWKDHSTDGSGLQADWSSQAAVVLTIIITTA